jgi:hypothetical protein
MWPFLIILIVFSLKSQPTVAMLESGLSQMRAMNIEDTFFYIVAAADSYLSAADMKDPRLLDYNTFIGGLEMVVKFQKTRKEYNNSYSIQQRDHLVFLLEKVIKKEGKNDKSLEALLKSLKSLPGLEEKESTLVDMLQMESKLVRYVSDTNHLHSMESELNYLNKNGSIFCWTRFVRKLSFWLSLAKYVVPDFEAEEDIRDALNFAVKHFAGLKYTQEQVLVLYLHVSLARFRNENESTNKAALLLRLRVVIDLIRKEYTSSNKTILSGILLRHLEEYPDIKKDFIAMDLSKKEHFQIDKAISYQKAPPSKERVDLLERVVLNWLGWWTGEDKPKINIIHDFIVRKDFDRFCPEVDLVRAKKNE